MISQGIFTTQKRSMQVQKSHVTRVGVLALTVAVLTSGAAIAAVQSSSGQETLAASNVKAAMPVAHERGVSLSREANRAGQSPTRHVVVAQVDDDDVFDLREAMGIAYLFHDDDYDDVDEPAPTTNFGLLGGNASAVDSGDDDDDGPDDSNN
ncbi:MAG: hypothetical protein AAF732_16240 [Pseudomonadota bacterium]